MSIFPAVTPIAHGAENVPWMVLAMLEFVRGLPIAIGAAAILWAATMAGGVIDSVRGSTDASSAPIVEEGATTLGVPLAILASTIFLTTGGPSRIAIALMSNAMPLHPLTRAAHDIASSVTLAVSLGAPILAASIILEVAGALVARAASPTQIHTLLAPLRALATLTVFALLIDRIATLMAEAIEHIGN
jgi:type III secretory pathway component EscT